MAIKTERAKAAIAEGVQAHWDEKYRQELIGQVQTYGVDTMLARVREELEAILSGTNLPPKGDRRELVRTLVRIIQKEEQATT